METTDGEGRKLELGGLEFARQTKEDVKWLKPITNNYTVGPPKPPK